MALLEVWPCWSRRGFVGGSCHWGWVGFEVSDAQDRPCLSVYLFYCTIFDISVCMHVCLCTICMQYTQCPEEGSGLPKLETRDSELPAEGRKLKPSILQEQCIHEPL